jgi:sugar phosphate permease
MGLWSTCYQVGGIAATALATWLLATVDWRAAFWGPALVMLAVGALILIALPSPKGGASAPAPAEHEPRAQPSLDKPATLQLSLILSYGTCYFCLKLIRYSLLFWLPYYLHTAAGFGEIESGYLSTSFELGGVVGSIGLGWLSDRMGVAGMRRAHAALGSIAALAGVLLFYAQLGAASMLVHFVVMSAIGALLFGPDALLSGAAAQDAAATGRAATAVGIVNGMGSAGALLQGALTVSVQRMWGWNARFYVFVVLAVLACACLLPALRKSMLR